MSEPADEFVTVAEAARRLGIDPRQVRRYLPRLSPKDTAEDTQRTHKGQSVVLIRLSAVEVLRKNGLSSPNAPKTQGTTDRTYQRTGQDTAKDTGNVLSDSEHTDYAVAVAQVEELRARVGDLSSALEHEREAHRRAETLHLGTMGELQRLQQRAAELESQNAKLIESLPVTSEPAGQAPDMPVSPAGDTESGDSGHGRVETPRVADKGKTEGEQRLSLWNRLFGKKT